MYYIYGIMPVGHLKMSFGEPEPDEPETGDMDIEIVPVWDKDGNEYAIPIDVLDMYQI